MIANQMRTNQLGLAATAWYLGFLDAVEAKDIGRVADYLADDVDMRIIDAPSIEGKAAVVEQLGRQWRQFEGVTHEVLNILGSDTGFVSESLHHYARHDGTRMTARAAVFTGRSVEGTVASIRIYSDGLPVSPGLPNHRREGIR
ncbi:MAG: nuclear transport factor 2 family protein [Geminicoccaceae bacterium]